MTTSNSCVITNFKNASHQTTPITRSTTGHSVMGYYLLFIGVCLFGLTLWGTYQSLHKQFFGTKVEGTIIGIDEQMRRSGHSEPKTYFHPVIEFKSTEGATFEFVFGSGSTSRKPKIGSKVRVTYPVNQPSQATLNSFMGLWAGPLACATSFSWHLIRWNPNSFLWCLTAIQKR